MYDHETGKHERKSIKSHFHQLNWEDGQGSQALMRAIGGKKSWCMIMLSFGYGLHMYDGDSEPASYDSMLACFNWCKCMFDDFEKAKFVTIALCEHTMAESLHKAMIDSGIANLKPRPTLPVTWLKPNKHFRNNNGYNNDTECMVLGFHQPSGMESTPFERQSKWFNAHDSKDMSGVILVPMTRQKWRSGDEDGDVLNRCEMPLYMAHKVKPNCQRFIAISLLLS